MKTRGGIYAVLICVLLIDRSNAIGIRNLRIDDLVNAADVIAIAEVADVKVVGNAQPIRFQDQLLAAKAYSAELSIRAILKGSVANRITVRYALPVAFVGYSGLHDGIRLVFLKRDAGNYSLADPYYSDFPATMAHSGSDGPPVAGSLATAVVSEMLSVVASPNASLSEKSEILRVDYALPSNDAVTLALKEALPNAAEPDFRQRLQGELIRFGDVSELPSVAHLLLTNQATENQRRWLLYVIANRVNDRRAIPALKPLIQATDNSLREAAFEALWHIADATTVPDLARALQDPDEQIRFYSVRALSDIVNELGWGGPSEPEFREHQEKYLTHWKEWASNELKGADGPGF